MHLKKSFGKFLWSRVRKTWLPCHDYTIPSREHVVNIYGSIMFSSITVVYHVRVRIRRVGDLLIEVFTPRWGSFWERSLFSSQFSLLDSGKKIRGAVPDCSWTCEFKRNSLSFDKAPKIWLSVLLSSLDKILILLFPISSEMELYIPHWFLDRFHPVKNCY